MPERVPAAGLLILRDGEPGEPGEPKVTLSPLAYHYQHRAEIEAIMQGAARDAVFDTLMTRIGAALAADRSKARLYVWLGAEAPRLVDRSVESVTLCRMHSGRPLEHCRPVASAACLPLASL